MQANWMHTISGGRSALRAATRLWMLPATVLVATVSRLLLWQERGRQRRHLAELSDHLLRDVGLTREDVQREFGKGFWRK